MNNTCVCCGHEISNEWIICPICIFDISSFKELSGKLNKYKHQLSKKRVEWRDIDSKILNAYRSKELSITTLCQTLIENLLKKPPNVSYSKFIFELYKNNEISPTENVFLGMLPILRNVVTHGKPPKFDPVYFSILMKALNCSIDIARRKGYITEVDDVDEYFVEPACYEMILNKIENSGIVLIIGEPTIGKTTIAKKVEKVFSEKYLILKEYPENPAMVKKNTLIILDNCFGDAKLDFERLKKTIDLIEECYGIGCKFLLTSRKDVFTDAKNTEYFKESAFCEIIHEACLEIKVDDYEDVYQELIEKLLKRYGASQDRIREALKAVDQITRELKTPGDIDRFCRQWAVDKSGNIDEIIKKSKFVDKWVKSILESADLESKYWLTFVLIYNSSPIRIRKLIIPIYHGSKKDKRQILIELFGKEVLRSTHPGISPNIVDIFEYMSHQLKKLGGIVEVCQVSVDPKILDPKISKKLLAKDIYSSLKALPALFSLNDQIDVDYLIAVDFAHETIEESVKKYIREHEPNLLRNVLKMLKDINMSFKSEITESKYNFNEIAQSEIKDLLKAQINLEEKCSPDPEELIIESYCDNPDILKDYSSFVVSILDGKFKKLKLNFPTDLLDDTDIISDDTHLSEISHIVIDTPLIDVLDDDTYEMLSDLIYNCRILLIRHNIFKDEAINNYILKNLSDPLFNLIITEIIASDIVRPDSELLKIIKKLLKYGTNVAKKTLIIKLFKDFDKIDDDLKEIALTELFKYSGYFIGEIFRISRDSAKLEIINRISNLDDKQVLRSFITFLILDIHMKDNIYGIFKYSVNGLMYFEDVEFSETIKKYNDKLSNINEISTAEIYRQISNTSSKLIDYLDYLKVLGFLGLDDFRDISEIFQVLKELIKKYGLDYNVIAKCALKNSEILFLLTMSEFIDNSYKENIILLTLLSGLNNNKFTEIFSVLLHFPNEFILKYLFKIYRLNLLNYLLNLLNRGINIFMLILYFTIKFGIKLLCLYYDIEFDKILNRKIIEVYEECIKLYDYDDELPEDAILEASKLIGWEPEKVKAVFDILSSITENIAENIISIRIPAVHNIIEEFVKEAIQKENDENVSKTAKSILSYIHYLKTVCGLEFLGPIIKIDLYKLFDYINNQIK